MEFNAMLAVAEALFEPTRLRLLRLLRERELCVCELVALFAISQPRMSQHLAVLRRAGLVEERRDGKWIYYRAVANRLEEFARAWEEFWRTPPGEQAEMREIMEKLDRADFQEVRENCPR